MARRKNIVDNTSQKSNEISSNKNESASKKCAESMKKEKTSSSLFVDIGIPGSVSDELVESIHWVTSIQGSILEFIGRKQRHFVKALKLVLCLAYFSYLCWAVLYDFELAKPLLYITGFVLFLIAYAFVRDTYGNIIQRKCFDPISKLIDRNWEFLKWFTYVGLILAVVYYLLFRIITTWRQVQSLAGMAVFIFIPWLTCTNPSRIIWRPVFWGLAMQFILGICVLRWEPGYEAMKWLSQEINKYLFYSLAGAGSAFGDPWFFLHPFAMLVIPLVIHVGCTTAICYHLGWIQSFSAKLGWLMKVTLQTTAIESVSLAANIFLSTLDTMLMLKKYIPLLTKSEFHCFLVGAHSTIAGFAFGLFVMFGVKPQHLLTGAIMSAPAAVAIAKLNYPETQDSHFKNDDDFHLGDGEAPNVCVAAADGTWEAGKGGFEILIMTLAFVAMIILVDDIVVWFGSFIGVELSLAAMVGYLFWPFAYLMGVEEDDLDTVSRLLGLKVIANEFLAYLILGRYIKDGTISERSGAIATYAMCGFSSFGTMAIFVGVWESVYPERRNEFTRTMPRIMMNSNLACFLTASIASVFYDDSITEDNAVIDGPIATVLEVIPGYDDVLRLVGFPLYQD